MSRRRGALRLVQAEDPEAEAHRQQDLAVRVGQWIHRVGSAPPLAPELVELLEAVEECPAEVLDALLVLARTSARRTR